MQKDYICKNFKHILHGGDYNPDQWLDTPEILAEDMRLMKLANCNEMSVGIFAWAALEPEEGKFNFGWLDKVLDDIYAAGGRVILATPSGARPAWLSQKYPEVLRVNSSGQRRLYGERHNHCYTSPIYREKVGIINRKLAERYKDHPAVIAWHLSNEYNGECFCPLCVEEFRNWLKEKYGTLENLNHEWWSAFWAHTFTDWNQIDPPTYLGDTTVHAKNLDWKRFVSERTADFAKFEYDTVKSITPNLPVTTNLMGLYEGLDYRRLAKELDFVSWDSYPEWQGDKETDIKVAQSTAIQHDVMRSLTRRPFFLMESTPSLVNWKQINKLKRPGVNELTSLQAIAHGSDSVQYFQWRKSRGSSEKFHGAVVDHLGTEHNRVFREVSQLGARLKKLDSIVGTLVRPKTAILYDWDNLWAIEDAAGFVKDNKKYRPTLESFYKPLWERGIDTDIIGADDDFSPYSVILAPMRYMVSEELGKKLAKFVENGGTLLCTYMTAMVNENDLCYLGGFPGAGLMDVFGIWNEEIDTLHPNEMNQIKTANGEIFEAHDYCELIHDRGAEVLARYDSDFYKGMPATTVNSFGKGKAYYIAFRDDGSFTDKIVDKILKDNNISSEFDGELPYGVTAHSRTDGENTFVFIENYSGEPVTLKTKIQWHVVETDEIISEEIHLDTNGTAILKK